MHEPGNVEAANLYQSYMKGWRDGAAFKSLDENFRKHENASLREAYGRGYSDGRVAMNSASHSASERYGYSPTILRTAEST